MIDQVNNPMAARITVRNNGSLRIEGDFEIMDQAGNKYDLAGRTSISLCRCGHSSKKPFCDSTHRTTGFISECSAYALDPPKPTQ
jgi:CDGSH-type Zn-finger protein